MKKRFLLMLLPLTTLVLELLPYGAVLNFANPEGEPFRCTFSYFSLTPFGYANFGPLFTAVLTCTLILLFGIYCVTGKEKLLRPAKMLLIVATACSLSPLVYGIRWFSVVAALISGALLGELSLLRRHSAKG